MHHQQFNIQQLHALPHCIYVFCIYLRTNSDLCHLQHKLIDFYNRDEKCLQRGTDWVFKWLNVKTKFPLIIILLHPNILKKTINMSLQKHSAHYSSKTN